MVDGLKRVVVTGMGITSCLGNDLDTVAENLKNAKYASPSRLERACAPCFHALVSDTLVLQVWHPLQARVRRFRHQVAPLRLARPYRGVCKRDGKVAQASPGMPSTSAEAMPKN